MAENTQPKIINAEIKDDNITDIIVDDADIIKLKSSESLGSIITSIYSTEDTYILGFRKDVAIFNKSGEYLAKFSDTDEFKKEGVWGVISTFVSQDTLFIFCVAKEYGKNMFLYELNSSSKPFKHIKTVEALNGSTMRDIAKFNNSPNYAVCFLNDGYIPNPPELAVLDENLNIIKNYDGRIIDSNQPLYSPFATFGNSLYYISFFCDSIFCINPDTSVDIPYVLDFGADNKPLGGWIKNMADMHTLKFAQIRSINTDHNNLYFKVARSYSNILLFLQYNIKANQSQYYKFINSEGKQISFSAQCLDKSSIILAGKEGTGYYIYKPKI